MEDVEVTVLSLSGEVLIESEVVLRCVAVATMRNRLLSRKACRGLFHVSLYQGSHELQDDEPLEDTSAIVTAVFSRQELSQFEVAFCEAAFRRNRGCIGGNGRPFIRQVRAWPEAARADKQLMQRAVSRQGKLLQFAHATLQADKDVVLAAVARYGDALKYASPHLRANKEVVLCAVRGPAAGFGGPHWGALRFACPSLQVDKDVVLEAIRSNGMVLNFVSEDLLCDKTLVTEAGRHWWDMQKRTGLRGLSVRTYGRVREQTYAWASNVLAHTRADLRENADFMVEVVAVNLEAIHFASETMRQNDGFWMEVVKRNADVLQYASEEQLASDKFMFEAIRCNRRAAQYLNDTLSTNDGFILESVGC